MDQRRRFWMPYGLFYPASPEERKSVFKTMLWIIFLAPIAFVLGLFATGFLIWLIFKVIF